MDGRLDHDDSADAKAIVPAKSCTVVRPGVFMVRLSHPWLPSALVARLADELQKDSRVTSVMPPEVDDEWSRRLRCFPAAAFGDNDEIVTGQDRFTCIQFDQPIGFHVQVPQKNQRAFIDDDIPSDYYVLWDGELVLVMWQQSLSAWVPHSGGHVIKDILEASIRAIGEDLYVQACEPGCDYDFLHSTLRVVEVPGNADDLYLQVATGTRENVYDLLGCNLGGIEDIGEATFFTVQGALRAFGTVKNGGRRLLDLHAQMLAEVAHIYDLQRRRAEITAGRWRSWPTGRFGMLGWRRDISRHIARIWSMLIATEALRGSWEEDRSNFEQRCSTDVEGELRLVFDVDYLDERTQITGMSTQLVREAIAHVSQRLDNRAVVAASLVGAIAGAAGGALVSGLHP